VLARVARVEILDAGGREGGLEKGSAVGQCERILLRIEVSGEWR
jgi:hypothetical protein